MNFEDGSFYCKERAYTVLRLYKNALFLFTFKLETGTGQTNYKYNYLILMIF